MASTEGQVAQKMCDVRSFTASGAVSKRHIRRYKQYRSDFRSLPLTLSRAVSHYLAPINVYTAQELRTYLEFFPIEYLSIEIYGAEEIPKYCALLESQPASLKEVVLRQPNYTAWKDLIKVLLQLKNLECLSLRLSGLKGQLGVDLVAQCCASPGGYHYLDLDFEGSDPALTSRLIEQLLNGDKNLLYLDLRAVQGWSDEQNSFLRSIVSPNVSLSYLRFLEIDFGLYGVKLLSQALAANCPLECVHVGSGPIGDKGIMMLGDGLAKNSVLKRLLFEGARISPVGGVYFARSLMKNQTLEYLTLKDEELGEEGGVAFGELLKVNRSLRELVLDYSSFGEEGCHHLVNALQYNPSLEVLRMAWCGINKKDEARLISLPREWHELTTSDTRLSFQRLTHRNPVLVQHRSTFKTNYRERVLYYGDRS